VLTRLIILAAALGLLSGPALADAPDLKINALTLSPAEPAIGHIVEVKAQITNIGTKDVKDFACIGGDIKIDFLLDGKVFGTQQLSCGLDIDSLNSEKDSILIEEPGEHTISVMVDPGDKIDELDETNNGAESTFVVGSPDIEVTPNLPTIGAPGLKDAMASVTVTNNTTGKIKDIYVYLELEGQSGPLKFGLTQGSNLSAGESHTWETEISYGLDISYGALEPGDYTWRYQVFKNALPPKDEALALTELETAPLEVVPTVAVTDDNIVVPNVDPIADSTGLVTSVTAHEVSIDGKLYTVALGFAEPVDFMAASSWTVFANLHALQVLDDVGNAVCDQEIRRKAAQAVLLWRDLIREHPWYKGTYIALQEGYDWYYDEKHLKVVYYITQPFVIIKELLEDMLASGKELTQWVKETVGLSTPEEAEVGTLTFKVAMIVTKGFNTAGVAAQELVKLSPILAGEPYLSGHVVSERLMAAIEAGGDDFDAAVQLMHDLIEEDSPERFTKLKQVLPPALIAGSIGSTLADGVKHVLWTGIKKGFTAYFISKLTAKTAWKVAVGEGSAALAAGLTTAGIAKGIASLGLTLIIDASIAYLTYVGTFIDNIRGPGGLIEAGQVIAQSIGWTHVLYTLDGANGPLDLDVVDDTFLAHAVMFEIYGFINSDLAMLKKLAFAKKQSAEYLEDSLKLFDVSKVQRQFAVSLQSTATLVAAGPCVEAAAPPEPTEEPGHDAPPERTEPEPEDPPDETVSPWTKPRAQPTEAERGTHPPVQWEEHSSEPILAPPPPPPPFVPDEESGCQSGPTGSPTAPLMLFVMLAIGLAWRRRTA